LRVSILLIILLVAGAVLGNFGLQKTAAKTVPLAAVSPANFANRAMVEGWNSTTTGPPCSPSGRSICNPNLTEFRGLIFNASLSWGDCCTHDFAIYTGGFSGLKVNSTDPCNAANTRGCLAKSLLLTATGGTVMFSFKPTIPADDFSGAGSYEYFCQFHPTTMHGTITVDKNPDLDKDGTVSIVDVATIAFAFGATALPTPSATWNVAADLNNDGRVDILDVALVAFYFGNNV